MKLSDLKKLIEQVEYYPKSVKSDYDPEIVFKVYEDGEWRSGYTLWFAGMPVTEGTECSPNNFDEIKLLLVSKAASATMPRGWWEKEE